MNLLCLSLALVLSALALNAQAQNRAGQDRYKSTAGQSTHAEKMRQSIEARIARASAAYEKAAKSSDESAPIVGLVSFRERLTISDLKQLRAACGGQLLELQRTIGETQMGWEVSAEQLSSEPYVQRLEAETKERLEDPTRKGSRRNTRHTLNLYWANWK